MNDYKQTRIFFILYSSNFDGITLSFIIQFLIKLIYFIQKKKMFEMKKQNKQSKTINKQPSEQIARMKEKIQ